MGAPALRCFQGRSSVCSGFSQGQGSHSLAKVGSPRQAQAQALGSPTSSPLPEPWIVAPTWEHSPLCSGQLVSSRISLLGGFGEGGHGPGLCHSSKHSCNCVLGLLGEPREASWSGGAGALRLSLVSPPLSVIHQRSKCTTSGHCSSPGPPGHPLPAPPVPLVLGGRAAAPAVLPPEGAGGEVVLRGALGLHLI